MHRRMGGLCRAGAADQGGRSGLAAQVLARRQARGASLPFLQAVFTAHYCIFDRHTPLYVKAVLAGAVAYCIVPDHLIPKHLPLIGLADDAAVIAIAMKAVSAHIEPEHRDAARRMLARMRSDVV